MGMGMQMGTPAGGMGCQMGMQQPMGMQMNMGMPQQQMGMQMGGSATCFRALWEGRGEREGGEVGIARLIQRPEREGQVGAVGRAETWRGVVERRAVEVR